MPLPIYTAMKQIATEKNIPMEVMTEMIEAALAAAYRKDFGSKNQNIRVKFNPETGESHVFDVKTVVLDELLEMKEDKEKKEKIKPKDVGARFIEPKEKVEKAPIRRLEPTGEGDEKEKKRFNPKTDIVLEEAKKIKKGAKVGDEIKQELEVPTSYGRMAAQTAKQVIIQRLREAERESLYKEFKEKEGNVIIGTVQRRERRVIFIDLGRITAILPPEEQILRERYRSGQRLKFFVTSVKFTTKDPEVIVSRSHPEIVRRIFSLEIPEIASDTVEIKSVAREAGSRSKVAVFSHEENIDPIGSCVGQRGIRIQSIISELGGEKIDIIEYDKDPVKFIANALLPAKISRVEINKKEKVAKVEVKEDQMSLAIGRGGQNVRLAARLTGWKINIVGETDEVIKEAKIEEIEVPKEEAKKTEKKSAEREKGEKKEEKEEVVDVEKEKEKKSEKTVKKKSGKR